MSSFLPLPRYHHRTRTHFSLVSCLLRHEFLSLPHDHIPTKNPRLKICFLAHSALATSPTYLPFSSIRLYLPCYFDHRSVSSRIPPLPHNSHHHIYKKTVEPLHNHYHITLMLRAFQTSTHVPHVLARHHSSLPATHLFANESLLLTTT